jgi:hypothetical protein
LESNNLFICFVYFFFQTLTETATLTETPMGSMEMDTAMGSMEMDNMLAVSNFDLHEFLL